MTHRVSMVHTDSAPNAFVEYVPSKMSELTGCIVYDGLANTLEPYNPLTRESSDNPHITYCAENVYELSTVPVPSDELLSVEDVGPIPTQHTEECLQTPLLPQKETRRDDANVYGFDPASILVDCNNGISFVELEPTCQIPDKYLCDSSFCSFQPSTAEIVLLENRHIGSNTSNKPFLCDHFTISCSSNTSDLASVNTQVTDSFLFNVFSQPVGFPNQMKIRDNVVGGSDTHAQKLVCESGPEFYITPQTSAPGEKPFPSSNGTTAVVGDTCTFSDPPHSLPVPAHYGSCVEPYASVEPTNMCNEIYHESLEPVSSNTLGNFYVFDEYSYGQQHETTPLSTVSLSFNDPAVIHHSGSVSHENAFPLSTHPGYPSLAGQLCQDQVTGFSGSSFWIANTMNSPSDGHLRAYPVLNNGTYWSDSVYAEVPESTGLDDQRDTLTSSLKEHSFTHATNEGIYPQHLLVSQVSDSSTFPVVPLTSEPVVVTCGSYDSFESNSAQRDTLSCPHCARVFSRSAHLDIHIRVHSGFRPHECVLCGRQFSQLSNLHRHLSCHKSWPPVSKSFQSSTGTQQPAVSDSVAIVKRTYPRPKRWTCRFCDKQLETYGQYRRHMILHKGNRVYACVFEACLHTFTTPNALLTHVIETHSSGCAIDNECRICGGQFSGIKQLVQHWLPRRRGLPPRCLLSKRKKSNSPLCNRNSSHFPGRSKSSRSRIHLIGLRKVKESHSLRTFRCPLCPRRCFTLNRLRQHLAAVHTDFLVSATQDTDSGTTSYNHPDFVSREAATNGSRVKQGRCNLRKSKTVLFLLHVDEEQQTVVLKRRSRGAQSAQSPSSTMSCEHCGKRFQKLKFFTDHQELCKQRIEERARRERFRSNRQIGFKLVETLTQQVDPESTSHAASDLTQTLGAIGKSMHTDSSFSPRRSSRVKSHQPLWKPKSKRSRKTCPAPRDLLNVAMRSSVPCQDNPSL